MERTLFSWEGWDQGDTFAFQFYDVTFKVAVGPYKAGDKADGVNIDYENGTIEVFKNRRDNDPAWHGRLTLNVLPAEKE